MLHVFLCGLWAPGTAAAAFEFTRPAWDSSSELLRIAREKLGHERVRLVAQLDWGALEAADAVLILHPTRELSFVDVSAFLGAGGRAAVIDDYGEAASLLARFRIRRISAPTDPLESFRNRPELAIARPHAPLRSDGTLMAHPVVEGVEEVVTNHATAIVADPGVELTEILSFETRSGKSAALAVVGVIGDADACGLEETPPRPGATCGRLFAMGDPSVFVDLMLRFEGNRKLLDGLLSYLMEDDSWGPRRGTLYIAANDIQEAGHFGGTPNLRRAVQNGTEELRRLLAHTRKHGLPRLLTLILAAGFGLGACVWAFRSSGKLYERYFPRYARPQALIAQGGYAGRFAVLSAPTTQPALLLLELKSAAERQLREHLALSAQASHGEILTALAQTANGQVLAVRLQAIFARMAHAERVLLKSEPTRISDESVKEIQEQLHALLDPLRPKPRSSF